MKRNLLRASIALMLTTVLTSPALARRDEPEHEIYDARLEGMEGNKNVTLEASGSSTTYILFGLFAAIALGGLFMDARRSHLD